MTATPFRSTTGPKTWFSRRRPARSRRASFVAGVDSDIPELLSPFVRVPPSYQARSRFGAPVDAPDVEPPAPRLLKVTQTVRSTSPGTVAGRPAGSRQW